MCIRVELHLISGLSWKEVSPQRNHRSQRKRGVLLYGCGSDERPDAVTTFKRIRTMNYSLRNGICNFSEYSILVRSETCSRQRIGIMSIDEKSTDIRKHNVSRTQIVKPWSPGSRSLFNCPAPCLLCTGISITFCSSDESPQANSHSPKYALFKVSPVGISNTCSRAL